MTKLLRIDNPTTVKPQQLRGFALWRLGFRPFYLLGALQAALGVPLWILVFAGQVELPAGLAPMTWHAHEMVYGFAVAIVTGFLFTAVRNWTDLPTPTGARLAGFCGLWLAARIAYLCGAPDAGIVLELLFLALVAHALLSVLLKARSRRNYFVGVLFAVLALADLAFRLAASGRLSFVGADTAIRFALYLIVTLTFVIGGRVIPMFTLNMVRGLRQFKDARLDRAAIGVSVLAFALELADVDGLALGATALLAALLQGVRLAGWRPLATLGKPILWILHAGYGWAVVGFLLMAAGAFQLVPRPLAVHAFAVGTVGGLIIGMITRTALGHTARMLVAGRAEVTMYALVQVAALLRVVGPLLLPSSYVALVSVSAACWAAAFLLYFVVYLPRLVRPRLDGKDG